MKYLFTMCGAILLFAILLWGANVEQADATTPVLIMSTQGAADPQAPDVALTTPTPTCCTGLTGTVQANCAINPGSGLADFTFDVQMSNPCPYFVGITHIIYLEVSQDGVNFSFIRRTSPTNVDLPPGQSTISGTFDNVDVQGYSYFRIRAAIFPFAPCTSFNLYSPSYPVCSMGGGSPTPASPTSTFTSTPTNSPTAHTPTRTATGTPMPSTHTSTATYTLTATASVTRTNTAAPTQIPGEPSATTASTNTTTPASTPLPPTATATATACTINFSDVPADHPFYMWIRCLACRGIISGYSDGTFRPFNEITRGQIAKMVSNAAGIEDDPGPQVYEDVPTGSPFYTWINRLSNRGFMGGYPCGLVPEEPCVGPGSRPYFRPNSNATRGQLAKIVSNAAELGGTPTGVFYIDVPEGHPFYVWIMRLTELGVMSGYPCGGENEPCDEESRPYFRPFHNVTRGQASKIVANTFFPGCLTP